MTHAPEHMSAYRRLLEWQWKYNSAAIDLVRIFIGGALLVRGIAFALDSEILVAFAGERAASVAKWYIIISHVVGGGMLLVGFMTRIGALLQIPLLVVAVFFVHLPGGVGTPNQSLETSGLVLVIMAAIFVFGAGRLSLDHRIFGGAGSDAPGAEGASARPRTGAAGAGRTGSGDQPEE